MYKKQHVAQRTKRLFSRKNLDFRTALNKIIEKLERIDPKYLASTNSYIPISLRPTNWKIVTETIADYLRSIK